MFTGSPSWDAALIWCPCGKIPELKGERSGLAHRFRGFSILSQPCCLWAWLKDRASHQGIQPTVMPFTWWTGSRQKESGLGFWYTVQSTPQLPSFFSQFPKFPQLLNSPIPLAGSQALDVWDQEALRSKLLTNTMEWWWAQEATVGRRMQNFRRYTTSPVTSGLVQRRK